MPIQEHHTCTTDTDLPKRLEGAGKSKKKIQQPKDQENFLLSPDSSASHQFSSLSDQILTDECQRLEKKSYDEFVNQFTAHSSTVEKRKEGEVAYDERFKLILDTFHNIGEIMLFEESELVVTDPRQFTQELVKNIMDHEILNTSHPRKPQEIQNILKKGIFIKNSFEGEDVNKYWSLLKATGLGVELTPLAMFIPLLIMEHTREQIEIAAVQFKAGLKQSCHRFACRYKVLNIAGNGIDFFHELTKVKKSSFS